jgi:hypothetical protein
MKIRHNFNSLKIHEIIKKSTKKIQLKIHTMSQFKISEFSNKSFSKKFQAKKSKKKKSQHLKPSFPLVQLTMLK